MNPEQIVVRGNKLAHQICKSIENQIKRLSSSLKKTHQADKPFLNLINVGYNSSSISYIRKKTQLARKLGIKSHVYHITPPNQHACLEQQISKIKHILNDSQTQSLTKMDLHEIPYQLSQLIKHLNNEKTCTGILLQLPIPQISRKAEQFLNMISPQKDVDCLTQSNRKQMYERGSLNGLLPCTPAATMNILRNFSVQIQGKKVCVIGRSQLVGAPVLHLLRSMQNVKVIECNRSTSNKVLQQQAASSDIVISAAGSPNLIKKLKFGSVAIDIGMRCINGKFIGDINEEAKKTQCRLYTPVPGGVGPVTVAMLMHNTFHLWQKTLTKN